MSVERVRCTGEVGEVMGGDGRGSRGIGKGEV